MMRLLAELNAKVCTAIAVYSAQLLRPKMSISPHAATLKIAAVMMILAGCGKSSPLEPPESSPAFKNGVLHFSRTPDVVVSGENMTFKYAYTPLYEGKGKVRLKLDKKLAGFYDSLIIFRPSVEVLCRGCASSAGLPVGDFHKSYDVDMDANSENVFEIEAEITSSGDYVLSGQVVYDSILIGGKWYSRGSGLRDTLTNGFVSYEVAEEENIGVE